MDFNSMFQPLVAVLWYLMPFFIIAGIVKTPWFRGKFGEFLVNLSARCLLDRKNRDRFIFWGLSRLNQSRF